MFVTSSMLWAVFTILMRKWRVDPIRATTVVAVLTALVVVPGYLAYRGADRLMTLPADALLAQGIAQGLIQGVVTLLAYSKAVAILGVSRAVLFPAIVPAISILIGIPLVDEWPDGMQIAGLCLVTIGLFTAVGLLGRVLVALRPSPRPPQLCRAYIEVVMPAYFIVRAVVHDPVADQDYASRSPAVLAKFGGNIARGGKVVTFEGPAEDRRNVIAEFTDFATAEACYRSADYQTITKHRKDCATFEFILVDGVEVSASQGEPT